MTAAKEKTKNDKAPKVGFFYALRLTFSVLNKKDKWMFVLLTLSALVTGFVYIIPTQILAVIINKITGDPLEIFGIAIPGSASLTAIILIGGLITLLLNIYDGFHSKFINIFSTKASLRLQNKAFEWLLVPRKNLDLKMTEGDACYRINSAPPNVRFILLDLLGNILPSVFGSVVALVVLCSVGIVSLPIIAAGGILIFLIMYIKGRFEGKTVLTTEKINSRMTNFVVNSVANLPVINLFRSAVKEAKLYKKRTEDYNTNYSRLNTIRLICWTAVSLLTALCTYGIILIYAGQVDAELIAAGSIVIIVNYVSQVFTPISQLGWFYNELVQTGVKLVRVKELEPKLQDIIDTSKDKALTKPIQKIELKNVAVKNNENITIENINFTLNKGELAVLTGDSGGGKTTALRALCGISEVESGQIIINNKIKVNTMYSYIDKFSVVMQSPYIFNRNVIDNILYPDIENNPRIEDMLRQLQMEEITRREYDEDSERSLENMLSGGEKKRICVLRGLIQNAEVYIFDEPTNELDVKNTNKVLDYINGLKQNAIVLVVTHDKRMIEKADKIIELNKNKVVKN